MLFSSVALLTFLLAALQTFVVPLNGQQKGLNCWRGVTVQRGREIEEERETVECQPTKHCGRSKCTFGTLQMPEQRTYKDCVNSCDELRTHCEQNNGTYSECNICSMDKCNFEDYPADVNFMRQSQEKDTAEKGAEPKGKAMRGDTSGTSTAIVGRNANVLAGIGTIFAVLITFYQH